MIIRNWKNIRPQIAHKAGIDWRLMAQRGTSPDTLEVPDKEAACLQSLKFVSLAWLQPRLSYEPHSHSDFEELYYIIKGRGEIRIDNKKENIEEGDLIYIPPGSEHEIINDGKEVMEFLAFAAPTK